MCAVAFGVSEAARVHLRCFSSGMATSMGLQHAAVGRLHDVEAKAWTMTSADATLFLVASFFDLFSYSAGIAGENLSLRG